MAIEHIGSIKTVPGLGVFGSLKEQSRHGIVSAGASAGSTYFCFRLPSNTRISGNIARWKGDGTSWSTSAYTVNLGIFGIDGNITDDDDAFQSVTTTGGANFSTDTIVINDSANYGKELWEFVNGQTEDPGGFLEIVVTLKSNVDNGGDFNINLGYLIF